MNIFDWVEHTFAPKASHSGAFIFDDMESQSGRSLPVIYQPFDAGKGGHWSDRGAMFDFLFSTGGGRLLDFGPGDGWPSLIVAPHADEVVGVEGSLRRADVCEANARRLGIDNVRFVYVEPEMPLPFDDGSFDGAMAASSVEQTPNPKATLRELHRVLRPGGRLRISYEALGRYRGGREQDIWLHERDRDQCTLILFNRDVANERVQQYSLTFAMPAGELTTRLAGMDGSLSFDAVTVPALEKIRDSVTSARVLTTLHPSGERLAEWLHEIGFSQVKPTHNGIAFAACCFDPLSDAERPADMSGVDALLRPLVKIVVEMDTPISSDPMITAIK
jgi:SAM-dependent methyltransferase